MYTLLGDLTIARWSVACCLCTLSWSKETVPMVIDVWVEIKPQLGGAFECIPLFVKKASCSDTVGSWKMEPVFTWWDTADSTNYLRESKKSFFHLLVNDVSGSRGVFPNVTEICFCVSSAVLLFTDSSTLWHKMWKSQPGFHVHICTIFGSFQYCCQFYILLLKIFVKLSIFLFLCYVINGILPNNSMI